MIRHSAPRLRQAAFTLIELLVVMAITVILLGLIFGPLVQGFNLTNRARVQVETQDTARRIAEIGQRDLAQAVFIFDNSQQPINFWLRKPDVNGDPLGAPDDPIMQPVPFSMVDIVAPARALDQDPNPNPGLIDPTTGVVANRGNVALPMAPGRVIIRYFVGLRDNASVPDGSRSTGRPVRPYTNFYDNPFRANIRDHNPFVLYRAVVAPFTSTGAVDTRFFDDPNNAGQPVLYDPNFFYDAREALKPNDPNIASNAFPGWRDDNGDTKVNICENWRALARALVPTDRADEALVQKGSDGKPLYYTDANTNLLNMSINPLVKFQPSFVGNDSGAPSSSKDPGAGAESVAPSTHRETYGHWTAPFNVYVYYRDTDDMTGVLEGPVLRYYYWDGSVDSIRAFNYNTSNNTSSSTNVPFFPSRYSSMRQGVDVNNPPLDRNNPPAIMFSVDPRRGMVNFAFPDSIWLYWDQANPATNSRAGDPRPSIWTPTDVATVNSQFDTYLAANGLGSGMRYIDLQVLPDGRTSPLNKIPNCTVVPGSVELEGPDMRPGPHHGKRIVYTRIDDANVTLGPNEYYVQLRNDSDFYGAGYATLDAMEQARLRKGIIRFDSQPDPDGTRYHRLPTIDFDGNPASPIVVRYKMQNNLDEKHDRAWQTVKADYLTRQLMSFSLGIRLYDLRSGQPQQVTLSQKISVRNLQR